ncbi:MAG: hypothetical protein ACFFDT_19580 [Candidatus Hodarchaeota archaeon]
MKVTVIVDIDAEGVYYSYSEELKGVYGQGDTPYLAFLDFMNALTGTLESLLKEAIELDIESIQVINNVQTPPTTA